jgi:His-Xaa-Ser system protein HxsD
MNMSVDQKKRSVSLSAPRKTYSDDAVRIAAHVFSNRAEVYHRASRSAHELTLVAKRRDADAPSLEALGGEFLNELLNQEYRFVVARFNRKVADVIAAQTLMSARGGEKPAPAAPDSPELEAEVRKLISAAEEEIRRTMPKKLAPQGPLYPPEGHAR